MAIVDDRTAWVGTANMDYRSLTDNLEVTAFIRDSRLARRLARCFDDDLAACVRLEPGTWRPPLWRRTLSDIVRLASPLL